MGEFGAGLRLVSHLLKTNNQEFPRFEMKWIERQHRFRLIRGFLPFLAKEVQSGQLEVGARCPGIHCQRPLPKSDRAGVLPHFRRQERRGSQSRFLLRRQS